MQIHVTIQQINIGEEINDSRNLEINLHVSHTTVYSSNNNKKSSSNDMRFLSEKFQVD